MHFYHNTPMIKETNGGSGIYQRFLSYHIGICWNIPSVSIQRDLEYDLGFVI